MDGSDSDRPRHSLSRADNPLMRLVGRVPITVLRKLLIAQGIVVVLLVTVGVLGLSVLSESNDRVDALGSIPERQAAYRQLAIDSDQLNSLIVDRSVPVACLVLPNSSPLACPSKSPTPYIAAVAQTDGGISITLQQLSFLTNVGNLGFVPPPSERSLLSQVHAEYLKLNIRLGSDVADDEKGTYPVVGVQRPEGQPGTDVTPASKLVNDADQLVSIAQAERDNLIAQNQAAYLGSQHLFIGVAAGSVVLALLLGIVLAWSVTGPLSRVNTRLEAIAEGDFSGHVNVANRDELGALATNLNRTNDELGRLYRELENASRHKSEFLANMSHELRTPLNAVIGFSEVLQARLFGELNDKQADYVADIHTSGRHLLALINDILDLSKIEAGRMELQVSTVALAEVLESSVALMRERATQQGISVKLEVNPTIGVIEADERKVKQVLFNLLSNALKFTARGGHVNVTARSESDEVIVSVRDDGFGVAPEDQARIFEEFEQVGTAQLQEGTGLGLALSRRFVELHGGRLWVESAPGQGSTFSFNLPRTQRTGASPDVDGLAHPEATGAVTPATEPL
jgi:signal transduction histidine kinase